MRNIVKQLVVFAVSLGLTATLCLGTLGCAGGLPTTHYYTLLAPQNFGAAEAPTTNREGLLEGLVIGVKELTVNPPYDQDRMVYRRGRGSTEVGFYNYHRWASPVGRLISLALSEGLRETPGIASIEQANSRGKYTAYLHGRVLYIEELDLPGEQQVRIALELELIGGDDQVLWSETLTGSASGEAATGVEIADAFKRAFATLLEQARKSLAATLAP